MHQLVQQHFKLDHTLACVAFSAIECVKNFVLYKSLCGYYAKLNNFYRVFIYLLDGVHPTQKCLYQTCS